MTAGAANAGADTHSGRERTVCGPTQRARADSFVPKPARILSYEARALHGVHVEHGRDAHPDSSSTHNRPPLRTGFHALTCAVVSSSSARVCEAISVLPPHRCQSVQFGCVCDAGADACAIHGPWCATYSIRRVCRLGRARPARARDESRMAKHLRQSSSPVD